ncbi:alpha/beta fold hydrolase [Halobacillus shinanisalinarum]|uniref:Alpha/beta fold hydrolase n=1 Tax=Halobacillus shinanisalinarum TaxID=2932258 RepID=A0ABY4GV10_9BACI|nr:alpha/beta fold hydrolase [Halobacillus shinanisalinarum]UOQ91791.1 alpha/beta fold hydrolase [Halobacillus shinanisalinarum]
MSVGCLCIHGYTGSPSEVQPLVEFLDNRTAWEISVPTLPGHGDDLDLRGHYYQEWIATAELALLELLKRHDRIMIIGFSMGGMIAAYLTAKYNVDRLVLLSAALKYISLPQMYKDIAAMVLGATQGTLDSNELFLRYQKKLKQTYVFSTLEFMRCVQFTKPFLKKVKCPVLIMQGKLDGMVPSKAANFLEKEIPVADKEVIFLAKSKHLICHGDDKDELFKHVLTFAKGF